MLDEREGEVPPALIEQSFNRKSVRQRIAIVAAGPIANFLLAIFFFWLLAMLGTQQIRPVIGAVESGSLAASGLVAGRNRIHRRKTGSGWSGSQPAAGSAPGQAAPCKSACATRSHGRASSHQITLAGWLKGASEPDPIQSLGLRPWRPAISPVLAEIDQRGRPQRRAQKW